MHRTTMTTPRPMPSAPRPTPAASHPTPGPAPTVDRREGIIQEAERWLGTPYLHGGDSQKGVDCSHLIHQVYSRTVKQSQPYMTTATLEMTSFFVDTDKPKKGDLVLWDGHAGIVTDPENGEFIGAQSQGVAVASYRTGYWAGQFQGKKVKKFRRSISLGQ